MRFFSLILSLSHSLSVSRCHFLSIFLYRPPTRNRLIFLPRRGRRRRR